MNLKLQKCQLRRVWKVNSPDLYQVTHQTTFWKICEWVAKQPLELNLAGFYVTLLTFTCLFVFVQS